MKKEQFILIGSLTLLFPVLEFFFQEYNYLNFYAHIGITAIAVSAIVFILHHVKELYWKLSIVGLLLIFSLTSWTGNWHEILVLFK